MDQQSGGIQAGTWMRIAVLVVALLLLLLFVVQNSDTVEVQFFFGSLTTRLVWALLLAAGLGFVIGLLLPRLRRR
jgi:uncharacterized integral membrane protein